MSEERAERLAPETLTPAQRRLFDAVTGGSRAVQARILPLLDSAGRLEGPFGPMLHAPELGLVTQELGRMIRMELSVSDREREAATLWCATLADSPYEREAHRRLALAAGLTSEEVSALLRGHLPETLSEHERAFATAAGTERWHDAAFAAALAHLTLRELTEAILLGGYYRMLATLLDAFGITSISASPPLAAHNP